MDACYREDGGVVYWEEGRLRLGGQMHRMGL